MAAPEPRSPADDKPGPPSEFDRTPPQDLPAEQSVLGGMLLSKDAIADVVEILRTGDFYRPAHATVFDAILDLYGRGEPADAVTVAAFLQDRGTLGRIGGAAYLHTLMSSVPTAANAGYYARIVAERAVNRAVIEAAQRVTQMAYAGGDGDELVDRAQQAFYDLGDRPGKSDPRTLGSLFTSTLDKIEAAGAQEEIGVPSGFRDLDRLVGGGRPGQLIVVGGRPGMGKSAFGVNWAEFAAINRRMPAAVITLEMDAGDLTLRVLASQARIPLQNLRNGRLTEDDWAKLARRMGELEDVPLLLDDTPNMTLMEIRAKARRLCEREGLRLLVVDYIGLMTPTRRSESRQQEVAEVSRGLKLLAMELGIPIIAVTQLNRGPEGRTDKRPTLADIRESGSVEQDADVVIFVHRDDYYDKESPRAGEADLIVAKHRNGPTDTVTVAAQLHFSRFVDMAVD